MLEVGDTRKGESGNARPLAPRRSFAPSLYLCQVPLQETEPGPLPIHHKPSWRERLGPVRCWESPS